MSLADLKDSDKPSFDGSIHTCALRGHSTSFQLVDEGGNGMPYAGLAYEVTDYEDVVYSGKLDSNGFGKVEKHYCGPVLLKVNQPYQGADKVYKDLINRPFYPLPITDLQVRAEKTHFSNKSGIRTKTNPAQSKSNTFYQVEVCELVDHMAHLPPIVERNFPPNAYVRSLFRQESKVKNPSARQGIALMPNRHTVLEVRPLRALRPMLSPSNDFCALNLYQLALMATLSYSDFAQIPNSHPVETETVSFPLQPSIGNWFGNSLAKFSELWQVDAAQDGKAYYPLYEEVPYSKRLEVVPFDPALYPKVNSPSLGKKQENPTKINFLDDSNADERTDTQTFITHHDELILISIRGTASGHDKRRDIDATQVPFGEEQGKVHHGFYGAAKVAFDFAIRYLDKFYVGQKLVITGHSLGGAVALIVSEMLRRRPDFAYDIVLYTYGAPRSGDKVFTEGARALVHHRIVNHNDPVPSLPGTWMNTSTMREYIAQGVVTLANPAIGVSWLALGTVNVLGDPYAHHGTLRHFMPVYFNAGVKSAILWSPGCSTINDHGCSQALKATDGLPDRGSFLKQLFDFADHQMVVTYIPNCWASLRRWQEALKSNKSVITDDEFEKVEGALKNAKRQLLTFESHNAARPDKAVSSQAATKASLQQEADNIETTIKRLGNARKPVTEADVYGLFAGLPALIEDGLPRWKAHPENSTQEQLAMSPPAASDNDRAIAEITGGHNVGTPFHLDIDSIA